MSLFPVQRPEAGISLVCEYGNGICTCQARKAKGSFRHRLHYAYDAADEKTHLSFRQPRDSGQLQFGLLINVAALLAALGFPRSLHYSRAWLVARLARKAPYRSVKSAAVPLLNVSACLSLSVYSRTGSSFHIPRVLVPSRARLQTLSSSFPLSREAEYE